MKLKEELRYAYTASGVQSVMICGVYKMHMLSAGSLAIPVEVSCCILTPSYILTVLFYIRCLLLQLLKREAMLTLVQERDVSTWTMYDVQELRAP